MKEGQNKKPNKTCYDKKSNTINVHILRITLIFTTEKFLSGVFRRPTLDFVIQPLQRLIERRPDLPYRTTIHSDQGF